MNYLYFAEADVQTGGASNPEALLLPADSYLGSNPVSTITADFFFKSVDGTQATREVIRLTYSTTANGGGYKRVNDAMCAAAGSSATPKEAIYSDAFRGMGVTTVAIT